MSGWQVGIKLSTGGVTFLTVQAPDADTAETNGVARAIELGLPASRVVLCSEIRSGPHHLVAMFDEPGPAPENEGSVKP